MQIWHRLLAARTHWLQRQHLFLSLSCKHFMQRCGCSFPSHLCSFTHRPWAPQTGNGFDALSLPGRLLSSCELRMSMSNQPCECESYQEAHILFWNVEHLLFCTEHSHQQSHESKSQQGRPLHCRGRGQPDSAALPGRTGLYASTLSGVATEAMARYTHAYTWMRLLILISMSVCDSSVRFMKHRLWVLLGPCSG